MRAPHGRLRFVLGRIRVAPCRDLQRWAIRTYGEAVTDPPKKVSRARGLFRARAALRRALPFALVAAAFVLVPSVFVYAVGRSRIREEEAVEKADAILVLGARVYPEGRPSDVLADRLDVALRLYRRGVAPQIVVSGDHAEPDYDEPGTMSAWLVARGVPASAVVQDGAGLDTYSSMARAKSTYALRSIVVVTQAFHLPRALYLASRKGLVCEGVVADSRRYHRAGYYQFRELFSRVRAFLDVARGRSVPLEP